MSEKSKPKFIVVQAKDEAAHRRLVVLLREEIGGAISSIDIEPEVVEMEGARWLKTQ